MKRWEFNSDSLEETDALGRRLSAALHSGAVVALNGPLGAGKTRLVQALAAAEGVPRDTVTSPTFVLINEYRGRRAIYHFDAYRLRDDDEFLQLGPEEYFDSDGLTLIEWAERVARCLPREHLEVRIETTSPTSRRLSFTAHGERFERALDELAQHTT